MSVPSSPLLLEHYGKRFTPSNLIVAAAGYINHEHFVKLAAERFQHLPPASNGSHDSVPEVTARIILGSKSRTTSAKKNCAAPKSSSKARSC